MFQRPNAVIIIAIAAYVISVVTTGIIHSVGLTVYTVAIIIWSYQELTTGVNRFRKILGGSVLLLVALSLVSQLR